MEPRTFTQRSLNRETLLLNSGATLDNSNVQELIKALSGAQGAGYKNIILDMAELEFISSAGVGAIFSKSEAARRHGGEIVLCNVSGNILYVLGELDVADHLTIKTSEQEAAAFCGVRL
jgi:anti-sigma B factor antagonist